MQGITDRYLEIRKHSQTICAPLSNEDYVAQPVTDVSPPKWHLGHTTWFFETFLLQQYLPAYTVFDPDYGFLFNSYYETVGQRVIRADRGNLTRPTVDEVTEYRKYVDQHMRVFLDERGGDKGIMELIEIGLQHEQQHQELLLTDIKYILGHNPLFPTYDPQFVESPRGNQALEFIHFEEGVQEIGFEGAGFCFDNEKQRHKVYTESFEIANRLVTNGEYLEFMENGGYEKFRYWHSEGWEWAKGLEEKAPLYWHLSDGVWHRYGMDGFKTINPDEPVTHISFYEAFAYAEWRGFRLPTESEWETACSQFSWGDRWEWTNSAYLPYPGFEKAEGALGEYNGKFMVNQMVLRGASVATSPGHARKSYRNFFHPHLRWQFTGIRLVK